MFKKKIAPENQVIVRGKFQDLKCEKVLTTSRLATYNNQNKEIFCTVFPLWECCHVYTSHDFWVMKSVKTGPQLLGQLCEAALRHSSAMR